jgi:hypothetical protein
MENNKINRMNDVCDEQQAPTLKNSYHLKKTAARIKDEKQLSMTCSQLKKIIIGLKKLDDLFGHTQHLAGLADMEPSIFYPFLDPFCKIRRTLKDKDKVEAILNNFSDRLLNREEQFKNIMSTIIRKVVINDSNINSLLFAGPPSTGKSDILQVTKEVLADFDIKVKIVKESLTVQGDNSVFEAKMHILGGNPQWNKGTSGAIFDTSIQDDVDLVILLLDEIDKALSSFSSILHNILDPNQDLCDAFFEGIPHNLRSKLIICCTANDTSNLETIDSLYSRLRTVNFPAYTHDELKKIVIHHIKQQFGKYVVDNASRSALANSIIDRYSELPIRNIFDYIGVEVASTYCTPLNIKNSTGKHATHVARPLKKIGFV